MLLSNQLASESLSPEPLLAAFENYRGTIHDLDRNVTVARNSLAAAVDTISAALERQGLQAGRRAVMAVSNGPLFVATLFAVLQRGGTPLLLFAETPAKELVRVARRHAADFLVTDVCPEDQLQNVATSVDWVSSDASWLQLAISNVASGTSRDAALYPRLPGVPLHPTSGTTGTPKLAVRPAVRAVAEADNYIEALQIDSSDLILCTVPMSHAYGYGLGTMVPLVSGASLLTTRRFHPKLLGKALREHPVTTLPLVPAMLDLLMQAAPDSLRNGPRRVTSAGAPLPERTAQRVKELTGTIVRPLYGTTETGVISVAGEDQELSGPCVGPPMTRVSARLEPVPGAEELTAGVGRLFIRSSSRMAGYVDLGGLDSSMLQDGWFETGDLARIDENGLIHLCGREKEVINVFGMKVLPGEVEEVLEMLPEVTDCKVYPGRHHSGSQIVKAAVAAAGLDVAAVRAHCEQRLATYKRPEVIHMLDALPRSPMGKILRDQLP